MLERWFVSQREDAKYQIIEIVAAKEGFKFATQVLYGRSVERRMDFGGNRLVMNQNLVGLMTWVLIL
jgi:hypothetical protein